MIHDMRCIEKGIPHLTNLMTLTINRKKELKCDAKAVIKVKHKSNSGNIYA